MTKKALIVDDEVHAQHVLKGMIEENFPTLEVVGTASNVPEAVKAINSLAPDIVFLDIEMPVYTGLELLDFFPKEAVNFHIIFVTAYNHYALDAFQLSATDYIVKPVQLTALERAIKKIARFEAQSISVLKDNLDPGQEKKILLTEGQFKKIVCLNDIVYFKADGAYTNVILTDGTRIYVSKRLGDFEYLERFNFYRSHRSHIINLNHVASIASSEGRSIVMSNKEELSVSKDKREELTLLIKKLII